MRKKRTVASIISAHFDIPEETLPGVPRLTVTGLHRSLVENHRGITELSRERIEINGGKVHLRITGDELELSAMNNDAILITGTITSVEFE